MKLRSIILSALIPVFVTGCASMSSIVKKPEIHGVKKIAIVSITAPQRVPHKSGRGEVGGFGAEHRTAIADKIFSAYNDEFKKLGWEVIPTSQLSALSSYQENFSPKLSKSDNAIGTALNKLSTVNAENTYFSPTGLYPVVWEEDTGQSGTLTLDLGALSLNSKKLLKSKMQEVALKSSADAAVLVQADYCYDDGAIWVGHKGSGTGSAVITGASAIYAVTPNGVEVIKMKRIAESCGGENRVASDTNSPMLNGHLFFGSEQIQKMFLEVARKSAAENVKRIQAAMK